MLKDVYDCNCDDCKEMVINPLSLIDSYIENYFYEDEVIEEDSLRNILMSIFTDGYLLGCEHSLVDTIEYNKQRLNEVRNEINGAV